MPPKQVTLYDNDPEKTKKSKRRIENSTEKKHKVKMGFCFLKREKKRVTNFRKVVGPQGFPLCTTFQTVPPPHLFTRNYLFHQ